MLACAEGNLKFFTQLFPSPLTNEDSLSILSPTAKPYHELILSNRISTFDFRVYVFARQARLLGRLGRKAEGMRKGAEFISSFGRWLEESAVRLPHPSRRFLLAGLTPANLQAQLPLNFVCSWIFSSCLNVIETAAGWQSVTADEAATERAIMATRAELLTLARIQVRRKRRYLTLDREDSYVPPSQHPARQDRPADWLPAAVLPLQCPSGCLEARLDRRRTLDHAARSACGHRQQGGL